MANSYAAPNFNIDTSTNIAGLIALKGGALATTDKIYVYNSAVLTLEQSFSALLISLGESSGGAAADGQRRGDIILSNNVTTTWGGNATSTNSGLKINPASAPGTASESKSCTVTLAGFTWTHTNAGGAFNATQRYALNCAYGIFGTKGTFQINYPSPDNAGSVFRFPPSATYTASSSHNLGTVNVTTGNYGSLSCTVFAHTSAAARTVPVTVEAMTINQSAQTTDDFGYGIYNAGWGAAGSTDNAAFEIYSLTHVAPAANRGKHLGLVMSPAAGTTFYFTTLRTSTTNILPTVVTPTGLAISDLGNGKGGLATITNSGSYAATDILRIYASDGTTIIGEGTFTEYAANSGIICGNVTLGAARNGDKCRVTSNNYVNTAFQGSVNWTPTKRTVPAVGKVMADAGQFGDGGTELTPTLPLNKVHQDQGGTLDLPDIGNVRDTDTLETVPGALSSNRILRSNATGSGPGNWNDDDLQLGDEGNVLLGLSFGLGQIGTLAFGSIANPLCLGAVDASPYAQGCILVRFYEMFCFEGNPYRYDFHIKPLLDGMLTEAEINAKTYYSCSFYQDQIDPDLYSGSPFGDFGIGSVVLAVESPGDSGDNIHLFTNQQYQIAVRAVARANDIISEDDNTEVVTSWSSGYQGISHIDIDSWPCLELCSPIDLSNVQITSMPDLAIASLPGIEFAEPLEIEVPNLPNINVHLFRPPKGG